MKLKEAINKAREYAEKQHKGAYRKFAGEPYVEHPKRVAKFVKKFKRSHKLDDLISAALLHDTIEDTDTTEEDLEKMFGGLVSSLVKELSSDKEEIEKIGKKEYLAKKMTGMSSWGLVIKLADRLDNVSDLKDASEKFREKYSKETKYILNQLEKNRELTKTQNKIMREIKKKLKELQ